VSNITCACLGGPDLDIMFITTAKSEGQSGSGGIFVTRVETKGLEENRFKD
jgi:sugar lactone lactonase YvrE